MTNAKTMGTARTMGRARRTWRRALLTAVLLGVIPGVSAQLNIRFDNVLDTVRNVSEASGELTQEREVALGRGVAARLFGVMPLVDDDEVQRYVSQIGSWLAAQTERADLPWRFAVTDTAAVNAFATPGGYVIVTRGLFALMQDEDQLAGVLAHEIAHVLRRHHLQAIVREARAALLGDAGATVLSMFGGKSSTLASIGADAFRAGMSLYADGLPAEDELEADQYGLVIAARAGYDPAGLGALLFTLDAIDPGVPNYALMAATHPTTRQRIDAVDESLVRGLGRYEGQLRDRERFQVIRARLEGL